MLTTEELLNNMLVKPRDRAELVYMYVKMVKPRDRAEPVCMYMKTKIDIECDIVDNVHVAGMWTAYVHDIDGNVISMMTFDEARIQPSDVRGMYDAILPERIALLKNGEKVGEIWMPDKMIVHYWGMYGNGGCKEWYA